MKSSRILLRAGITLWLSAAITQAETLQEAYLKASNAGAEDHFGRAVAMDGDTLVIGAYGEASNGTSATNNSMVDAGAVYVFVRNGSGWTQQAYLKAAAPTADDLFGYSVAISGDTIVVGARDEDSGSLTSQTSESEADSGAAYVFVRSGTTWTQQAYLKARHTSGASDISAGDAFGYWVDVDGDTVAVGARSVDSTATNSGAAYVYTRSGTTWSIQQRIKGPTPVAEDDFGAVSLSGDTLVVGSPGRDTAGTDDGAAHVYTRSGGTWTYRTTLLPTGASQSADMAFGEQVALSAGTLAIRASGDDLGGTDSGAVFVFTGSGDSWTLQQKLKAANPDAGDEFGRSVALDGDILVAGAPWEDSNAKGVNSNNTSNVSASYDAGAAYVFHRLGGAWSQRAYLKASNTGTDDAFGYVGGAAVSGDKVAVGAYLEDGSAANAGAVYAFRLDLGPDISVEYPAGTALADGAGVVHFGSTAQALPVTRTLLVKNDGLQALEVTSLATSPGFDCPDTVVPFSLAPGAALQVTVRYLANQPSGPASGTLVLTSNDSDAESSFDLALTANTTIGGPVAGFDVQFGSGGASSTAVGAAGDYGRSVAVQSDGRILVAGDSDNGDNDDFAVVRYLSSGALDTSFGSGGKVTTDIAGHDDHVATVLVQSNGRIVVAGYSWNGTAYVYSLARYTAAGVLDTSFSSDGKVTAAVGSGADYVCAAALQGDDDILVTGLSWNGSVYALSLARFSGSNGALDTSFSSDGKVITSFGSDESYGTGVAVQNDGKIVVAGFAYNNGDSDIILARYTTSGALDTSFGTGGKVNPVATSSADVVSAVAIQADGGIVVTGHTLIGSDYDFLLTRYTDAGLVDTTFGNGGRTTTDFYVDHDYGNSVCIQNDGRIIVGGQVRESGYSYHGLARYTTAGMPDVSFGHEGVMVASLGEASSACNSVALQSDGRILAAGYAQIGGHYDFSLVRFGTDIRPTVVTDPATGVGPDAAVLHGSANPNGVITSAWFEYGPTPSYGSTTASQPLGYGASATPVSAGISGLTPGTTYHYRLVAQNGSMTAYGEDSTLATPAPPGIAVFAGTDESAPQITDEQPAAIDFGTAPIGGAGVVRVFTVKNVGGSPLNLAATLTVPSGWLVENYDPASLAPGTARSFTLRFQPTLAQNYNDTMEISSNAPGSLSNFSFPVMGTGVAASESRYFLVSDSLSRSVLRVDGDTGAKATFIASSLFLGFPKGMTVGPDGHLYVTDTDYSNGFGVSRVLKFNALSGALMETFVSTNNGISRADDLAFDGSGNLYVLQDISPLVVKYTSTGTLVGAIIHGGFYSPNTTAGTGMGIGIGPDNRLYLGVSDSSAGFNGGDIARFNLDGNYQDTLVDNVGNGNGHRSMIWDAQGNFYSAHLNDGVIRKFDGQTGAVLQQTDLPSNGYVGLSFAADGYLVAGNVWNQTLYRFKADGTSITTVATGIAALEIVQQPASGSTSLETWRSIHFGTTSGTGTAADAADPDKDGRVNLLEWAMASDPLAATPPNTPLERSGPSLTFEYTRSITALDSGATFNVEWSDTLTEGSWSVSGVTSQVHTSNATTQQIRATIPMGTGGRRFVRMRVMPPP